MEIVVTTIRPELSFDYIFKVAPGLGVRLNDGINLEEANSLFESARKMMKLRNGYGDCTKQNFRKLYVAITDGGDFMTAAEVLGWKFWIGEHVTPIFIDAEKIRMKEEAEKKMQEAEQVLIGQYTYNA